MSVFSHHENYEKIMGRIARLCPGENLESLRAEIASLRAPVAPSRIAVNIYRLLLDGSDLAELVEHLKEVNLWKTKCTRVD